MERPGVSALYLGLFLVAAATLGLISWRSDGGIEDDGLGTPYIVSRTDNVCGLTDPMKLSCPASVSYSKAIASTPQARKLRKRGIDPDSAEGIILMIRAGNVVRNACVAVQRKDGLCSVWKKIRRRDGAPLPDITAAVIKEIARAPAPAPSEGSYSSPTSSSAPTSATQPRDAPGSATQN